MPPPPIPAEALYSSPRYKTFATIDADTNLVALGGGPCRRILIGGAGTLVLVPSSPLDGQTSDTITDLLAGTILEVQADKIIDSGTTASKITVFW